MKRAQRQSHLSAALPRAPDSPGMSIPRAGAQRDALPRPPARIQGNARRPPSCTYGPSTSPEIDHSPTPHHLAPHTSIHPAAAWSHPPDPSSRSRRIGGGTKRKRPRVTWTPTEIRLGSPALHPTRFAARPSRPRPAQTATRLSLRSTPTRTRQPREGFSGRQAQAPPRPQRTRGAAAKMRGRGRGGSTQHGSSRMCRPGRAGT